MADDTLTPKQRRELLDALRAIRKRLDDIDAMLDFILRARKIKRPARRRPNVRAKDRRRSGMSGEA
jgi:DNA-binding PadR family transcriptional regulator